VAPTADSPHLPVTFLADPSDDEVKELYQTSELYVFPSRYEGFGLPGLEAMTQGLPVISSDSSCLPEIYGQAAHYFQSDNLDDLVQALEQVATSPVEQERLRLAGYARAADFSWQRLAVDTLAIYEKALS
jgi:glycosyltransferase involved in cell wall biosynthesis